MDKADIVHRLEEIAIFLELQGASPFEILAFRNAAQSLHEWEGDLRSAVTAGSLVDIPAIGKGIAAVITEFVREGRSDKYTSARNGYPATILELFAVPGLGLKNVKRLYAELGVDCLDALEQAAVGGAVHNLRGFGARSEARIIRGIAWVRRRAR